MTTIAPAMIVPGRTAAGAAAEPGRITIIGLAEAEEAWRELETAATMTPYGRFDWVASYAAGEAKPVLVAIVTDEAGRPIMLLPVHTEHRLGVRVATSVGGKHANLTLPLLRREAAATLGADRARTLLGRIGSALGVDVIELGSVPATWDGRPVPWACLGAQSPSDAVTLRLDTTGEATLARSMSPEARKKLRNKTRRLEKLGSMQVIRAETEPEVDHILAAFYRQKEARFQELGIADPFASPETQSFLRLGALAGLSSGAPAIELHALKLDDDIIAILGGAADRDRLSGMMLSFAANEAAKFSPGEVLVTHLIGDLCRRGFRHFDLGVGEARYKRSICDETLPLVDVVLSVSVRGRFYALASRSAGALKRSLKRDPRATALLARMRRLLARRRKV